MLYREIIAVCSQIYTKHINTLCGQSLQLLNFKLALHIVRTQPYSINTIFALCRLKHSQESGRHKGHVP